MRLQAAMTKSTQEIIRRSSFAPLHPKSFVRPARKLASRKTSQPNQSAPNRTLLFTTHSLGMSFRTGRLLNESRF